MKRNLKEFQDIKYNRQFSLFHKILWSAIVIITTNSLFGNDAKLISLDDYFKNFNLSYHVAVQHPVLPKPPKLLKAQIESLKKDVQHVMDMTYSDICLLIDEKGDINYHYNPEGEKFVWDIKNPWILTDPKTGKVFPNSDYPMTELKLIDPLGKEQTYSFYENKNGERFFFYCYCRTFIRNYFVKAVKNLARIYAQTGEEQYAFKTLQILTRFAEVYPHWPYRSYIRSKAWGWFRRPIIYSKGEKIKYDTNGGRWQSRWHAAEIQYDAVLVVAYDLTYNENILNKLSEESGVDVRKSIEQNLLLGMVRAVLKYPASYFMCNAGGYIFSSIATTGRVLGYPELIHLTYALLYDLIQKNFFFDGMWKESTVNYHDMTVDLINKTVTAMNGYSDPPGFMAKDGRHFENISFNINSIRNAPKVLSFPNGSIVPINDSRISCSSSRMLARNKPTAQQFTDFLSATGHVSLGRGSGDNQMQYHMTFTNDTGHRHIDMLNTIMFAKKCEMISDIGYGNPGSYDKPVGGLRSWTASTLAHNTVLVDKQMQKCKNGSLVYLLPNTQGITAVEAKSENAYPQCKTYKRFAALIDDGEENAFVIDIFRLQGGKTYDWLLHGSSNDEMALRTVPSLANASGSWLGNDLKYIPGRDQYTPGKIMKGTQEIKINMEIKDTPAGYLLESEQFSGIHPFYGLIENTTHGQLRGMIKAQFSYMNKPETGFNLYMLNKENSEVFTGNCPSIRKAWGYLPNAPDSIPIFLCRRKADENSQGIFAAVIEPFSGKTFIKSVKDIKESGDDNSVAINVITDDKSHLVLNTAGNEGKIKTAEAELEGRFAVITLKDEKPHTFFLSDGKSLTYGNWHIKALNNYKGNIDSVNRSVENNLFSFDAKAELPEGDLLKGNIIIVTFDKTKSYGYKISHIEKISDGSRIFLAQEPGFIIEDNNASFLFFPQQSYNSLPEFTIPNKVMINIAPDKISLEANASFELKTPDFTRNISLKDLQTLNGVLEFKIK